MAETVTGIILAGGAGRRIGGRKPLRLLAGRMLVSHVVTRLAPQLAPGALLLNVNDPSAEYDSEGLPVVRDSLPGQPGPLAGLLAGFEARPGARFLLSVPADTPFLPRDFAKRLVDRQGETNADIVLARSAGGLAQVCGLWATRLAPKIAASLAAGQYGVFDFATRIGYAEAFFETVAIGSTRLDPFFNINTADDLAAAERTLANAAS